MNLSIRREISRDNLKAVLFDLDGVLIETEHETFQFYQKYLKEHYGIILPDSAFQLKAGRKSADFWQDALTAEQRSVVDTEKLTTFKRKQFNAHPDTYIKKAFGGKELIQALRMRGWQTGLTTQNEEQMMRTVLAWLDIESLFDVMLSLKDITKKKPDPEIYLKAAQCLAVAPSACIVIEDSKDGVASAKNAGMRCIGIAHPYTSLGDLDRADTVVHALAEIAPIIAIHADKKMQTNR
ncbi:MAG: hypothetical protein A3J10_00420 [Candidatus Sungbacteria bacterium RIFCSPLOWO2_02_FULL_54_10]|uniref:FCP1 homology domain-containing protein n=2 Tax=Candidatus Sungiibacteriota TaxID=1817917 RepID=A0A1G2L4Y3_9BACT|nr:MAG: hypothetical protein A2679_02815 [Candidatus Sungbacteria bacterium RIFCSPHIGHO2_01_FULL_54_26]OHA03409.1 MAG: hypothetical protein A3C92_01145 [Candidatus Sungbacteria bacterium RIFCSPHIGHO2_02_FULL_53_17]OHA06718.1 MAG: hypothetical protein A3B34_02505 [Candidatus Sungbacteria bacterium RIFCSPLOWO2_01_FULL_54_21]OHA12238.1 MAG: hypothetical protein A3J10_00420 [Candidatus Sungbacteria bacterium RIFCSPLOWO2_02_FULL_54_10]